MACSCNDNNPIAGCLGLIVMILAVVGLCFLISSCNHHVDIRWR
jgi:hypothetical protein